MLHLVLKLFQMLLQLFLKWIYFSQLKQKRLEGLKSLLAIIWSDLISSWIYACEKIETLKNMDSALSDCGTEHIYSGTGPGFDFGKVPVQDTNQVPDPDHM
jgi:hypothetical protein